MNLEGLPVWELAIIIFLLRICDVSIGTFRTIAVVQGRTVVSVILGFFEVLIWVLVMSNVLRHAAQNPVLLLAYAGGFATGNAVGIQLERSFALGHVVLRIISVKSGELVERLRSRVQHVSTFVGQDGEKSVMLLFLACRRRDLKELIAEARGIDPELFFAVDPLRESSIDLAQPLPHPTGWRAVFKMK